MEFGNDTFTKSALLLAIGFPVTELLLSEAIQYLRQQGRPLSGTLQILRNLLIPSLASLIFLTYIGHLDPESWVVRFNETVLWICTLVAALSLFDILLFFDSDVARQSPVGTTIDQVDASERWQSRIPKLFRDLARVVLILVGASIILSATWKIDLGGLVTALGIGSVVIGLALQDTLGSIAAGITLLFEQPFKKGDWLRVGDLVGKVTDINWRSVRIETIDMVQITIPHLIIGKQIISNYSQPIRAHREEVFLAYAYAHPPNLVKQVLRETALSTPGILEQPGIKVGTYKFEDSGISYRVTFFVDGYQDRPAVRDEFQTRVWYANQRYRLKIPYPVREVYQVEAASTDLARVNKFSKDLQQMPVLEAIEVDSFGDLAKDAVLNTYAAGEQVYAEGDRVMGLYFIIAGKADASLLDGSGNRRIAYSLSKGDCFGEISLFNDRPSPVAIHATEDLEVILIIPEAAKELVDRRPSIARDLGLTIEARTRMVDELSQTSTLEF